MEACFTAAETFAEKQPKIEVQKVYDDWANFRNNQGQWFNVAEQQFAKFNFGRKLK